ncbi:heterogeneous nuclear ribonucleoprotein 1-like isoform X2 [Impatiens glandulifera]|uniref:heterogeneous nuclear ribonucleoprotein 1-like isoform X1 n=1 Tax=Impatiens glandulifera TaxID=253017 RepID=UPI001FB0CAF3|nr:heterogeneous nuclear ribonucleoprotein 1-like isoform X1 [Impatiens glandulifera]XP_047336598.1 heterogeneous nuclear ribonucleoprotein 1-like isoform X2 [Impatiens glandulifera]
MKSSLNSAQFSENMELDMGKLFVGGISCDTDKNRLKEYFSSYGEVIESMIMRDRVTGRARGFGFIVFADPAVAERVIMEKHIIDGRTVEAKKAVPRDDHQQLFIRTNNGTIGRTRKIFVGGLASSVTERDFKKYFDQFGIIIDVVVMYDHNTQRPRGFGFITFDSEEAVERALQRKFHELNGKMVEVKQAIPKELSPVPNRIPLMGFEYGFNRISPANSFLNSFPHGYGSRFDPFSCADLSHFGNGINSNFGGRSIGYGRVLSPFYGANNSNRYCTPVGYGNRSDPFMSSAGRSPWGNVGINSNGNISNPSTYFTDGSGNFEGLNWCPQQVVGCGRRESDYVPGSRDLEFGANRGRNLGPTSFFANGNSVYASYPVYGSNPPWHSTSSEINGFNSFSYGPPPGNNTPQIVAKNSEAYNGHYNLLPNRGVDA